mmetsp:Transcript_118101/g.306682  ORF Transcript_118101/g.306682 Transcript_118101/m.306682 type:complete len:203 (-) Transcript_118101:413-1021(-)
MARIEGPIHVIQRFIGPHLGHSATGPKGLGHLFQVPDIRCARWKWLCQGLWCQCFCRICRFCANSLGRYAQQFFEFLLSLFWWHRHRDIDGLRLPLTFPFRVVGRSTGGMADTTVTIIIIPGVLPSCSLNGPLLVHRLPQLPTLCRRKPLCTCGPVNPIVSLLLQLLLLLLLFVVLLLLRRIKVRFLMLCVLFFSWPTCAPP